MVLTRYRIVAVKIRQSRVGSGHGYTNVDHCGRRIGDARTPGICHYTTTGLEKIRDVVDVDVSEVTVTKNQPKV